MPVCSAPAATAIRLSVMVLRLDPEGPPGRRRQRGASRPPDADHRKDTPPIGQNERTTASRPRDALFSQELSEPPRAQASEGYERLIDARGPKLQRPFERLGREELAFRGHRTQPAPRRGAA